MPDVLSDILDTIRLSGTLYFRTDFTAPWAIKVPDYKQAARFHLVVQGRLNVAVGTASPIDLGPGDMILIPRGRAHILADSAGRPAPPLESVVQAAGYKGEGALVIGGGDPLASTQLVCGHFSFRNGADHPLLRAMPDYLVTTAATRARQPWLDEMLRLVTRKVFTGNIGTAASVVRLSEVVFIEFLQVCMEYCPELAAVLTAMQDPQIGRSLSLMHADPGRSWTVESLASEVGMSRSRFADRFRDLVGSGPMGYLSLWRLQKALAFLAETNWTVQQIAARTGYQSPAAFTRAFSEAFGAPPSKFRQSGDA